MQEGLKQNITRGRGHWCGCFCCVSPSMFGVSSQSFWKLPGCCTLESVGWGIIWMGLSKLSLLYKVEHEDCDWPNLQIPSLLNIKKPQGVGAAWVWGGSWSAGEHCSAPAGLEELVSAALSWNNLQPPSINTLWIYNSVGYSWHVTPENFLSASFSQSKRKKIFLGGAAVWFMCSVAQMLEIVLL